MAQPVLITAAWGLAFLVSVPLRRPLAGVLARTWYPFPRWFRAMLGLTVWSIRYAMRGLADTEPAPPAVVAA